MKRWLTLLLMMSISVAMAGCAGDQAKIPELTISYNETIVNYSVVPVKSNGREMEKTSSAFVDIAGNGNIVYIPMFSKMQIKMLDQPDSYWLKTAILTNTGEPLFPNKTYDSIPINVNDGYAEFTIRPDRSLVYSSTQFEPKSLYRGYILHCEKEDSILEYHFIIRTDPIIWIDIK